MKEGMKEGRACVVGYLPISLVSLLYMVVWFASPIWWRVEQGRAEEVSVSSIGIAV
jgi:hypothetical protein